MLYRQETDPSIQEFITPCTELSLNTEYPETIFTNLVIKSDRLRKLTIINFDITKLDVSKCTVLRTLICTNNNITELIVNNNLKSLDCTKNKITKFTPPEDLTQLICA